MAIKNYLILLFVIPSVAINFSCSVPKAPEESHTLSFDDNWHFAKDAPEEAALPSFDDSNWRLLDLPHDWSIEDLPNQSDSVMGPFSKSSVGKMRTAYTIGGTAWYRKTFTIGEDDNKKIAYLQFDGIFMNSDVWINGRHVGNHPYGYTSFYYDITSYLNPAGQPNVVAVQVKNEGSNSRWYSGSGIYRHTWLTLVNTTHIVPWGVFVKTPSANDQSTDVSIISTVVNSGPETAAVKLNVQIMDNQGNAVASSETTANIQSGEKKIIEQNVVVANPRLWSVDAPNLYTARVTVFQNDNLSDVQDTKFGIRSIDFSASKGFLLNGKPMELIGGCIHHDNGPLGAKAIDRAEERKIELLKNAGFNAIRCSHNPPSPYLLDVCDRLGILVIDEIFDNWENPKVSPEDYSKDFKQWWQKDLELMVVRDRNHPSVIMWSIGNEIREALDTAGLRIARNLTGAIRNLDNTRPVTEGFNDFAAKRGLPSKWHESAPHHALLDVVGYNYMFENYVEDHEKYPERVMVATEFMPLYSLVNWKAVEDYPYVIGNFAWVAMDYLGEAGVGLSRVVPDVPSTESGMGALGMFFSRDSWPIFNDFQGDIDLIGNRKSRYYHQLVVWRKSNIEMMVHEPVPAGMKENVSPWGWPEELKCWNWEGHEGETMQVHVYTRSTLVKLELNGKVIGEQSVDGETSITATFEVPFAPGILIARCYDNGMETGADTIQTVGKPAAIRLVADRASIKADRNDLSYVMAEIIDENGNIVPNANEIVVDFSISGKGEIAGVGSGSPIDMSSFQQPHKKSWHGKCLAIIRPIEKGSGIISLAASAEGLKGAAIQIDLKGI
ncbi:MAG: glycoside hydrolase family 2 TIM barrel-domain containing protein [Bacteroidia bacterium]